MTASLESVVDWATQCARYVVLVDPESLERALEELEHAGAAGAPVERAIALVSATLDYRRAVEAAESSRPPRATDPSEALEVDSRPRELLGGVDEG